ncbi:MAG: GNAT family N-acetyltransferase [Firmicutes bacterium]|nr:GNAT family N-acetyltransferase [Bacillota bacterium]
MEIKAKFFDQLTAVEVYEILKARCDVFIVEQTCFYPDVDGTDYDALHIFYDDGKSIKAYLRAFPKEGQPGVIQVGRVLTVDRGTGLGGKLLHESISIIQEKLNAKKIVMEAQCYATGFYEKEGFVICGEEFLEDGIPHIEMEKEL